MDFTEFRLDSFSKLREYHPLPPIVEQWKSNNTFTNQSDPGLTWSVHHKAYRLLCAGVLEQTAWLGLFLRLLNVWELARLREDVQFCQIRGINHAFARRDTGKHAEHSSAHFKQHKVRASALRLSAAVG